MTSTPAHSSVSKKSPAFADGAESNVLEIVVQDLRKVMKLSIAHTTLVRPFLWPLEEALVALIGGHLQHAKADSGRGIP